jgi:hypothetical protein
MKKIICLIVTVLTVLLCVTSAFAAQTHHTVGDIAFSLDSDYSIYKGDSLAPASSVKGLTFMAVSSDNLHQIQARCTTTEFSKQLDTFSGLDDEILKPVAQKLFDGEYETLKIGSYVYLKELTKNEKDYTAVYVTVSKGKLYTFTYFGTEPSRLDYFVTTVTLPASNRESNVKTYIIILITVFIIADLVFLAFLIMSFVRDYKRRKMEQSENIVSQYIKIKRRKY